MSSSAHESISKVGMLIKDVGIPRKFEFVLVLALFEVFAWYCENRLEYDLCRCAT
jgi:hypothetical protein